MRETGVVGGVCMAHAPQFFTLPETEDKGTVARVEAMAIENGKQLAALKPDVYIVIANDHANQFLLHCVPSFTLHRGPVAKGTFAGRDFSFPIAADISTSLIRYLQEDGFDPAFTSNAAIDYAFGIPLTFLRVPGPVIPLYVNAYVPPQPRMERCFAFGQAMRRGLEALGVRAVVVTSGGLSHFPGTERYAEPDLAFDKKLVAELATGNMRYLLALDEKRLDETGNIELRCWGVAAGMLGERKPDMISLEPSWHHNYATIAWWSEPREPKFEPHYPPVHPELVTLTDALQRLAYNPNERARFIADPQAFANALGMSAEDKARLLTLDQAELLRLGVHALLPFMAKMGIERQRQGKAT